jgi:hypothetical protein
MAVLRSNMLFKISRLVCSLSPLVRIILFLFQCEARDRTQLREYIFQVVYTLRKKAVIYTYFFAAFVSCVPFRVASGVVN